MLILKEYADFLAKKLKESKGNYLDVVIAFLTGWACTDSTKSFSITIRRMLGLPYVGSIESAYSQLLPRLSSDPAFRSKALEAVVLALERDWVRKDLLEVAWKNAARELLEAMKELYQTRKNYAIKMFIEEIERAIMAQEAKTFETVPPPMSGGSEEIVLPPQPKEEEIKQIEKQQETTEQAAEESGLDILIDLFESMKTSLDNISDKISGLTSEIKDLKDYLHYIGENIAVIPGTFKALLEDLTSAIKEIKFPEIKVESASTAKEVQEVKPVKEEQVKEEEKRPPKIEIAQKLISELESTLSDEELLVPQKTERELFVCVGNLSRLGSMLTDKSIMSENLRWNIKITAGNTLYDIVLQGLYRGIPDNILQEILNEGVGLIIMFPIKNKDALQGIVDQLSNLMKNLKFVIIDSDSPVMDLEKLKGARIILQKIRGLSDLESILKEKVLPNL